MSSCRHSLHFSLSAPGVALQGRAVGVCFVSVKSSPAFPLNGLCCLTHQQQYARDGAAPALPFTDSSVSPAGSLLLGGVCVGVEGGGRGRVFAPSWQCVTALSEDSVFS